MRKMTEAECDIWDVFALSVFELKVSLVSNQFLYWFCVINLEFPVRLSHFKILIHGYYLTSSKCLVDC